MEIEMAEKDPIAHLKELDAERTKLIDEAKKDALARAKQAITDLNAGISLQPHASLSR
jgi:hypothetical protein